MTLQARATGTFGGGARNGRRHGPAPRRRGGRHRRAPGRRRWPSQARRRPTRRRRCCRSRSWPAASRATARALYARERRHLDRRDSRHRQRHLRLARRHRSTFPATGRLRGLAAARARAGAQRRRPRVRRPGSRRRDHLRHIRTAGGQRLVRPRRRPPRRRHPPAIRGRLGRIVLEGEQIRLDLIEGRWQGAHLALSGMVPTWFAKLPGSSRTSAQATLRDTSTKSR